MGKKKTREAIILREARLRMGYSQQEVANAIGVHIKQYQRLEFSFRLQFTERLDDFIDCRHLLRSNIPGKRMNKF